MSAKNVILVDCPRDAIQGIHRFIPSAKKAEYINALFESSLFDWVDFGSFVSAKAVPQMADTAEVLEMLEDQRNVKLLAIVANKRGAETGVAHEAVDFLGYPFSISEEFQQRNTNRNIAESFESLKVINDVTSNAGKETVVYISMGFGNPYGDFWSEQLVIDWIGRIKDLGIREFSLADTTGEADSVQIEKLFKLCTQEFPELRIGAHFHSVKDKSLEKIKAAFNGGCRKFDGAVLGFGGCPFAQNELVGNIPSEDLLCFFNRASEAQIMQLQENFNNLIK